MVLIALLAAVVAVIAYPGGWPIVLILFGLVVLVVGVASDPPPLPWE